MKDARTFSVNPNHPALPGHFPGRPVLPGVVLLDEALAAVAAETGFAPPWRLGRVKFSSPALPGDVVTIRLDLARAGSVGFVLLAGERQLLSGSVARLDPPA